MDLDNLEFEQDLSAFDYMMFRADMDARSRTALMFIETLDAVPDMGRLRDDVERASRVVPRLRQRVVAPLVPITPAKWVFDPEFTLDYHFRRISLPEPGTFRQLLDLAETLHATPLDLTRPLWELTLVEGLHDTDAKAALCWKLSHTVTDGVSGMVLDQMLHQDSRDPDPDPLPLLPLPEDVTSLELTTRAVRHLPSALVRRAAGAVKGAAHVARHPIRSTSHAVEIAGELKSMAGSPPAEPSPLLRRRSLNRRYDAIDLPLADLRAAAKPRGCSVNDAYLAAIAGGMRRYHEAMGVPLDAMTLGMPVNARDASGNTAGNQWSAVTLRLPIGEKDPATRMRKVREVVLTSRPNARLDPGQLVAPLVAWLPQQLIASGGPGGQMSIDIQASNVPGHTSDRYIAGCRIVRSIPFGPLPGIALMSSMVTFSGRCFIGIVYDTASFTDSELLERCLREGFDEVIALAKDDVVDLSNGKTAPRTATTPGRRPRTSTSPSSTSRSDTRGEGP